jgi:hypothetical protein
MNLEFTLEKIAIPHTVLKAVTLNYGRKLPRLECSYGASHHIAKKPFSMLNWSGFSDLLLIRHA